MRINANWKTLLALSFLIVGSFALAQDTDKEEGNGSGSGSNTAELNVARPGFIPDNTPPQPDRVEIMQGFDDITSMPGWDLINNSSPIGSLDYFQGNPTVFTAQAGPDDSYLAGNFNSTAGGTGIISNWALTPELDLNTLDTFSFWTRTSVGSQWPDRVEVRLSTNGNSSNVGATANDVGDFDVVLLEINPSLTVGGYPEDWTQFVLDDFSSFFGTGRIAFRYFVTDAGPSGTNSNFIGIDSVESTEITCSVTGMSVASYDATQVMVTLEGSCASPGVDLWADGQLLESGLTVPGSYVVDAIPDAVYAVSLAGSTTPIATATYAVPTLGEWGMIAFMLVLMVSGLVFLRKRRLA